MRAYAGHVKYGRYDLKTNTQIKLQSGFPRVTPQVICLLLTQVNNGKIEQMSAKAPAPVFAGCCHAAKLESRTFKLTIILRVERCNTNQFALQIIAHVKCAGRLVGRKPAFI